MRAVVALVASLFRVVAQAAELHEAARLCDVDHMRQVLSRHPRLSETDEKGLTALNIAIDSRHSACVRMLLEAGADPRARDQQGRNAFDAALKLSDMEAMKSIMPLLWNSTHEKAPGQREPMPWSLEYTAKRGQTSVTDMLLAMGADPNAVGTAGTTPLADAALKGDVNSVRALIAHGARVNAISVEGTQPIHDAALDDSADVIRELAMHGADVNARTRDDAQTPLHIAAAMGKMKAAEALVALGADLTVKDSKGRTPLDVAERADVANVVEFLRRAGAAKTQVTH